MARVGEIIENPVTGERFTIIHTAEETNGEVYAIDMLVKARGFAAAEHFHPTQEELFEVRSGTLCFRIDGKETEAGVGQTVVIPPGITHTWWNAGNEAAEARVSFRPALNTETFFETFFGLARDGKTNRQGLPNALQLAVMLDSYQDFVRLPLPLPAQLLFKALTPLAYLLGYRASYPQYSKRHIDSIIIVSSKQPEKRKV